VFLDTVEKTFEKACQPSFPVGFECLISDPFELAFQSPQYTSSLDRSTWDTPGPISNSYEDKKPTLQTEILGENRNIPWLWPTTSQSVPLGNFETSGSHEVQTPGHERASPFQLLGHNGIPHNELGLHSDIYLDASLVNMTTNNMSLTDLPMPQHKYWFSILPKTLERS
jgi:hypothetical protein